MKQRKNFCIFIVGDFYMDDVRNKKILIVDDEDEIRNMVDGFLRKEGFTRIYHGASCKEALEIFNSIKPHIAILDIMLPDGDGFSLLQTFRQKSNIPVLFLSARGEDEDRLLGLGLGADDYIVKPFLPRELVLRLTAILRRVYSPAVEEQAPIFQLGNRTIDLQSGIVKNGNKELPLTAKEYALLLDYSSSQLLKASKAWAMLIDDAGQVTWEYMLPEEVPKKYALTEVAKFSRNYLMDYPVFVWEHDEGLVVVGYPKFSLAKYQHILPSNWVSSLPSRIFSLIIGNIALALVLSLLIGSKLIKSIRPLTQAIQGLAQDKEVFVEPKGILASLANSVNNASDLLRQKNESLKARDEARSNWIAGISHDIRTPLSIVLGYASDLEENDSIPTEQRKQAGIIRKQAEKLGSLVNDLNLVSMLEYEMQPLRKKPIRLSTLARQIATDFLNNGLDQGFTLEVEVLDERVQTIGDEKLLARAITNLVQNSIDHNPDGCRILLQTSFNKSNKTCSFIVIDNGRGIPEDQLPDLLELPYSSKRKFQSKNGHGLGLPMVARIAKAHRGFLILSSHLGKGLRAEIVLPSI